MYYVYGVSGPSLLLESTDSMLICGPAYMTVHVHIHLHVWPMNCSISNKISTSLLSGIADSAKYESVSPPNNASVQLKLMLIV